jgi:uncharacterized protein (TIGR02217 family)
MSYLPTRWNVPTPINLVSDPDVFPLFKGQEFISQKSPTFPPTIVRKSGSGREIRVSLGDFPTWQFKVAYEVIRNKVSQNELQRLFSFFNTRLGQFGTFFFYDPEDNAVSDCSISVGDGVTKIFQLTRCLDQGGGNPFYEPIYVTLGTPVVTVNGSTVSSSLYTLGPFGAITFTTAPGNGFRIAWTGQFLFLCRFAEDQLDVAQMVKQLYSSDGLPFQSWMPL